MYYNGSHESFECTNATSVMERRSILQAKRRCFSCTGARHALKKCKSKHLCYHCKGKHYSSVFIRNETFQLRRGTCPVPGTAMRDSSGHIRNGPAAYESVQARIGGQACRILLDGGSGKSHICREHGKKLASISIRSENCIIDTVSGEI